jgi:nucleotide-binding universal stress UspA family protein
MLYANVVVGTDGSHTANLAVAHACELVTHGGGTLHIVHAWDVSPAMARLGDEAGDSGAMMLAEVAAVCADTGATVQTHLMRDDPADALLDVADAVHADLIVIGNRGMSGAKRFLLGSVPNKVSHHAHCTVLIVRTTD